MFGVLAAAAVLAAPAGPSSATPAGASSPSPRASLPTIEPQVMCVTCKIPLNLAQSPQASSERQFIQSLIDQGRSEAEIKDALVGQYGPSVLALPRANGFDLAVYLVPLLALLALLTGLALLLPRWLRHTRAQGPHESPTATLSATDAARLEADLSRFD